MINPLFQTPVLLTVCLLHISLAVLQAEEPSNFHETFGASFDASRFSTPIPSEHTEVRDGVLWTHGPGVGNYPPMVYLPVEGTDLTISFRYRQLEAGGWMWFFVDGDDGFGSVDHMLRVKLLRDGVQLEVDSHSQDANHPMRQKGGHPADKVSGAYRLNEFLPVEKLDLSGADWREVRVVFVGEQAKISVDGATWTQTLSRPCFNAAKRKLLWMQKGGEQGIEVDDIRVSPTTPQR